MNMREVYRENNFLSHVSGIFILAGEAAWGSYREHRGKGAQAHQMLCGMAAGHYR